MSITSAADIIAVTIANLVNLLMVVIFLVRIKRSVRTERQIGIPLEITALPLLAVILFNLVSGRSWWLVLLPVPLVVFLTVELILDYLLKVNFRTSRMLGPYLGLYYLALFGMVGYSFLVGKTYGLVTLVTYFGQLLASWYSYSKAGHGATPASAA
jgi:hypothetical protein